MMKVKCLRFCHSTATSEVNRTRFSRFRLFIRTTLTGTVHKVLGCIFALLSTSEETNKKSFFVTIWPDGMLDLYICSRFWHKNFEISSNRTFNGRRGWKKPQKSSVFLFIVATLKRLLPKNWNFSTKIHPEFVFFNFTQNPLDWWHFSNMIRCTSSSSVVRNSVVVWKMLVKL